MSDIKFNSINELYNRLKPALNTKKDEIYRSGMTYIRVEDIWNFLKENAWNKTNNLNLYQMVDDIMNIDIDALDKYIKEIIGKYKRTIEQETDLL